MTLTVLQLSDIHFGPSPNSLVSGHHPEDRLATVVAAWLATGQNADLVVLTGDITDEGTPEAYDRVVTALRPLDTAIMAISGNHDDDAEVARAFGGAHVAELENWRIVGLNSARPDLVNGIIDVDDVCALLDAVDDRPTVLAIHHPPRSRSTGSYFKLDGDTELLEALAARPHVRAVISGHLHDAFEFTGANGLELLGGPSTLMAIRHEGESFVVGVDAPTGGRVLHLADDGTVTSSLLLA